jgi:hypothetical protein
MTQSKSQTFPILPVFPNWSSARIVPDSIAVEQVAFPKMLPTMATKSDYLQQRHVTRVVKGALAGGFQVSSMRVDRDGAIVLFSKSSEPEAREEPRLSTQHNEWDEVLKK